MPKSATHKNLPVYDCYCNLNRGGLSFLHTHGKQYGRLAAHGERVCLYDAVFRVQKGGHARAVKEGRRNVHAFVRGHARIDISPSLVKRLLKRAVRIHYRPFDRAEFFREDTGEALVGAERVIIDGKAAYAINPVSQAA